MISSKKIDLMAFSLCYVILLHYVLAPCFFSIPVRLVIFGTGLIVLFINDIKNILNRRVSYKDPGFIIFIIWSFYSLLMIFVHGDASHFALGQALTILVGIAIFSIPNFGDLKKIIDVIAKQCVIAGFILCIGSIISIILVELGVEYSLYLPPSISHIIDIAGSGAPRYSGLALNPNTTSAYLMVSFFFGLYLFFLGGNLPWRIVLAFACCIELCFIVLVSSRTSLLSIAVFIFMFSIFMLLERSTSSKKFFQTLFLFILMMFFIFIFIFVVLLLWDTAMEYVCDVLFRVNSLKTATGRTEIWKTSLNEFKKHPIFGVSALKLQEMSQVSHLHNSFIQILTSTGIVGLCLYFLLIIYSFYSAVILLSKRLILNTDIRMICYLFICILIALLIHSCFEQMSYAVLNIVNIVMVVSLSGIVRIHRLLGESNT